MAQTVSVGTPHSLGFNLYSVRFDSLLSQYIDCGNLAVFDPGVNDFTIFLAFKTPGIGAIQVLAAKAAAGYNGYYLRMGVGGLLTVMIGNGPAGCDIGSVERYDDDRWHFAAFGKTGLTCFLRTEREYRTSLYPGGAVASGALRLFFAARDWAPTFYYTGELTPLLFYGGHALTLGEFQRNMLDYHSPLMGNLELWLPLNDGAGTTATGEVAGRNGSLLPAPNPPVWNPLDMWEIRSEARL